MTLAGSDFEPGDFIDLLPGMTVTPTYSTLWWDTVEWDA